MSGQFYCHAGMAANFMISNGIEQPPQSRQPVTGMLANRLGQSPHYLSGHEGYQPSGPARAPSRRQCPG